MSTSQFSILFFIARLHCTIKLIAKSGSGCKSDFLLRVIDEYKDVAEGSADKTGIITDKYRRGIDMARSLSDVVDRCERKPFLGQFLDCLMRKIFLENIFE